MSAEESLRQILEMTECLAEVRPVVGPEELVVRRVRMLILRYQKQERLIGAYRKKRRCDGLNGRMWDATRHLDAEKAVKKAEAELAGGLP